uniref:hypothetical protein n=1 Tax=Nonomuraea sp. CA-252377 TaxID=3240003 RepID=UPI003F49ADF8
MSRAQLAELVDYVAALAVREQASWALPASDLGDREHGYGIGAYTSRGLYGVIRPCPYSLDRLAPSTRIFVRNAREKALITGTEVVDAGLVTHFDLPDHEQTTLL